MPPRKTTAPARKRNGHDPIPAEGVFALTIDGTKYEVDAEDLTLGELATIEEITGCVLAEINYESGRALQALAWVALHRADPSFTVEDAGNLRVKSLAAAEPGPDPTPAGD